MSNEMKLGRVRYGACAVRIESMRAVNHNAWRFMSTLAATGIIIVMLTAIGCTSVVDTTTGETGGGSGSSRREDPAPTGGDTVFSTAHVTNFGVEASCASCHGDDGSGGSASGIRGSSTEQIAAVTRGEVGHPADPRGRTNIRFPELTQEDIAMLAVFLSN